MSLTNQSQVLIRNIDMLSANYPLFINFPEDGFIDTYIDQHSPKRVTCFNSNYFEYQAITRKHSINVDCQFSSHYQAQQQHDLVIITFPKSKAELAFTLSMIAPAISKETKILFIGEKKGGIQSTPKLTSSLLINCQKIDAARHCMLFAGFFNESKLNVPFELSDWFQQYQVTVDGINLTIASLPGVFSQQKLDVGTALLLNNLKQELSGSVLDFGCGAGVISCFIGKKFDNVTLSLLDVSALAIASAKETLKLNGLTGQVFASDSLSEVKDSYQHVVSNPPFHQGIKTNYQATEYFLSNIKKQLKPKGGITVVANSFLRYQPIMEKNIGQTKIITQKEGFTIYHAQLSSR